MSRTIGQAIEEIQAKIGDLDSQALALKKQINVLCQIEGIAEMYPETSSQESGTGAPRTLRLRVDEFTSDKLAKAVRKYLQMRREANPNNGPARIEEIRDALSVGGFDFRGKDPLQALSVSLGKSTHTFKRVGKAGHFGLAEWYGVVRTSKVKGGTEDEEIDDGTLGDDLEGIGESLADTPPSVSTEEVRTPAKE